MQLAREQLGFLDRPLHALAPGEYRAYLAPAALEEVMSMLCWGGFSAQALASKSSPLQKLYAGDAQLSPLVSFDEQVSQSLSPAFSGEGYPRQDLSLVKHGKAEQQLVSSRSAAEYGLEVNGAPEGEAPSALAMAAGSLVQADILKEDQAQNTCIFSTEFSLRMMADVQEWFIANGVRHFYSVSISGYHIAEAGANPITQLALTLANGFTYVETYLARGMAVDDFAPNLSFFFSNGMDPEYSVIGRVARRIWAVAMKNKYGANERSQKLKYHIQTSGRSLHAQEIQFNDIRTTLQALIAIYDNCNSLHTNAYDEAITTPTEESVRRAVAIQMIINKELGLNFCENPWQGSFIVDKLTDIVEEAVYKEFEAISERGRTSPWRRSRSSSSANSLAVRSIRLPARVTRRRMRSRSRSAARKTRLWQFYRRHCWSAAGAGSRMCPIFPTCGFF